MSVASAASVIEGLRRLFPEHAGDRAEVVAQGWEHALVRLEAADGSIHMGRVPLRPEAGLRLDAEARLLTWLAPRVPVPVPRLVARVGGGSVAGLYPRLPGEPEPRMNSLGAPAAAELGAFLRVLHSLDADEAVSVSGVDVFAPASWQNACADLARRIGEQVLPSLDSRRRAEAIADLGHLLDLLGSARFVPAVVHGDLSGGNLLWSSGRLSGVLDWSDAFAGDPAAEFGPLVSEWGPGSGAVLEAYGAGAELRERARLYGRVQPLRDALSAAEAGDAAHLREVLGRLP